jgi:hypothetical protein
LEAQIKALTRQNVELLLKIPRQSHPEVNLDEYEEERNSHANGQDQRDDDHQEVNF